MLRALVDNRLNLLLVSAPISWAIHVMAPELAVGVHHRRRRRSCRSPGSSASAPSSSRARSGPALGGLLNATFGNAAELIIATVALSEGRVGLVKASITGSIVGNLLLVLGLAFFVGGLGRRTQKFHRTAATNAAAMLFLAVVALVMPAVFDLTLYGTLAAEPPRDRTAERVERGRPDRRLHRQPDLRVHGASRSVPLRPQRRRREDVAADRRRADAARERDGADSDSGGDSRRRDGTRRSIASGFTELFVGVIVIAIIGNAAEHYSAVIAARRDQMTLAVEIAVGSSAQIALLVGPVLVLFSYALGHPMSLLFNAFEITAIALSVIAASIVVVDGESNWVEGLQLMAVYLILGLAFYFVPPSSLSSGSMR